MSRACRRSWWSYSLAEACVAFTSIATAHASFPLVLARMVATMRTITNSLFDSVARARNLLKRTLLVLTFTPYHLLYVEQSAVGERC